MTDGHENDGPSKSQNMKLQDKNRYSINRDYNAIQWRA